MPYKNPQSPAAKASNIRRFKKWCKANPTQRRQIQRDTKNRYRVRNRKLVSDAKSKPCMDCGNSYPPYVMDLDHVRGKKSFGLALVNARSVKLVMKEIKKCDVVCSNCHRLRTHRRRLNER